jgi:hypothetical protein
MVKDPPPLPLEETTEELIRKQARAKPKAGAQVPPRPR